MLKRFIFIAALFAFINHLSAQTCTNIGQTPESAFPVCGTEAFTQNNVPICGNITVPVPCNDGASYQNKNPYWYKFTCYQAGTLGFIITPNNLNDDYDWQLFDITGHNPSDVFTDPNLFVACDWSGEPGETGASQDGNSSVNCAGTGIPLFSSMPILILNHEYLLLVSHFTNSQSGYQIVFSGGNASITDPVNPALANIRTSCDGTQLIVKTNKKVKCATLAADGTDFTLSGGFSIISAIAPSCGLSFDMDSVVLTLNNPLPVGNYTLTIQDGSDGNTLLDNCGRPIPEGSTLQFTVAPFAPTPMDSIKPFGCSPNTLQLVFQRPIKCNSVAANTSDFTITGPQTVSIASINTNCSSINTSSLITLKLSAPIVIGGTYQIHLQTGSDGNTIIDECGRETLPSSLSFVVADTVYAGFSWAIVPGCRNDTVSFSHDGRNGVTSWNWTFDNAGSSGLQNPPPFIYSSASQHSIQLIVSNGVCKDTITQNLTLDNKVIAEFETANIICPEDAASFINESSGTIDSWLWKFGDGSISNSQTPAGHQYPLTSRETFYTIKLIATNNSLNCSDSITHTIRVLSNCFIAVPSAFTPNGDGLNDYLYPLNALKADDLDFKVFNRWGQLVFSTRDWQKKWDGKINGILQPAGVYVWFLRFTHHDTGKKVFMKGTTMLMR